MQKKLQIWTIECWNYEIKLKKSEQSVNVRSECLFYDKTVKLLHQKRRISRAGEIKDIYT